MTKTELRSSVGVSQSCQSCCLDMVVDLALPAWESLKHLDAFMARDDYADLAESSKPAMAPNSPFQILHASCTENPTIAFESPFAQVYIVKPKEGRTAEELKDLISKAMVNPTAVASQKGRLSLPIWGETVESPGTFVAISGWDSIEAVSNPLRILANSASRLSYFQTH